MMTHFKNCLASLIEFARQFFLTIAFLLLLTGNTILGQPINSSMDFGTQLSLEKVFTIHAPSKLECSMMKLKVKNGIIYILNDNYFSNKGMALVRVNISTNECDTNYFEIDEYMISISCFDVSNEVVYILKGNVIYTLSLRNGIVNKFGIRFPSNLKFSNFEVIDSTTFVFFEWQIGQRKIEDKCIYRYHKDEDKWDLIDQNTIDGLNFLAVNSADKYIDVSENTVVKFKPNRYELFIKSLETNKCDTIRRSLDTSIFISDIYIRDIHTKYQRAAKRSLFDSMDNHCNQRARIRSIRISGDSIVYIFHVNKCEECEWTPGREFARYLDIWKYNKLSGEWVLQKADLRLDNYFVCEKSDNKKKRKNMLPFNLIGVEDEWDVYSNYLIIPKMMSDKINLEGDLSYYFTFENFEGGQNIQLFVFKFEE